MRSAARSARASLAGSRATSAAEARHARAHGHNRDLSMQPEGRGVERHALFGALRARDLQQRKIRNRGVRSSLGAVRPVGARTRRRACPRRASTSAQRIRAISRPFARAGSAGRCACAAMSMAAAMRRRWGVDPMAVAHPRDQQSARSSRIIGSMPMRGHEHGCIDAPALGLDPMAQRKTSAESSCAWFQPALPCEPWVGR
jgi:hypothetical protein